MRTVLLLALALVVSPQVAEGASAVPCELQTIQTLDESAYAWTVPTDGVLLFAAPNVPVGEIEIVVRDAEGRELEGTVGEHSSSNHAWTGATTFDANATYTAEISYDAAHRNSCATTEVFTRRFSFETGPGTADEMLEPGTVSEVLAAASEFNPACDPVDGTRVDVFYSRPPSPYFAQTLVVQEDAPADDVLIRLDLEVPTYSFEDTCSVRSDDAHMGDDGRRCFFEGHRANLCATLVTESVFGTASASSEVVCADAAPPPATSACDVDDAGGAGGCSVGGRGDARSSAMMIGAFALVLLARKRLRRAKQGP